MTRLLDIRSVCIALGGVDSPLNPSTVYRLIERGELSPPVRIGRTSARWPQEEIEAYIAARLDPSRRQLLPPHEATREGQRRALDARKSQPKEKVT